MSADRPSEALEELHLHRVLVALDGSEHGLLALRAAITVARRDWAALTLLCVADESATRAASALWAPGAPPVAREEIERWADGVLSKAVGMLPPDIPARRLIRHGRPGPEIVTEARASDYDAVLLGARGLGRVGSMVGSVSFHVLRNAEIAVFVVHAPRQQA